MSISRVERPGLLGVASATSLDSSAPDAPPMQHGTTQQRHAARVDQQYALAQYAAQQQYVSQQRQLHPDGNFPSVRDYARTTPPESAVDRTPITPDIEQVRELVELRATNVLTDAEFTRLVSTLFRAPASAPS